MVKRRARWPITVRCTRSFTNCATTPDIAAAEADEAAKNAYQRAYADAYGRAYAEELDRLS